MRLPWQNAHAPAVAFAVLALAGGIGLKSAADRHNDQIYQTQLAGCQRDNALRAESNKRIVSHSADKEVLREFLDAARSARVASFSRNPTQGDRVAIEEYERLMKMLDTKVKFRAVPLINCEKVTTKP